MKRCLLCTILMCAFSCLSSGHALADAGCPANMILFSSADGQQICMPVQVQNDVTVRADSQVLDSNDYREYQAKKLIHESMLDPGLSLELGFGYSMVAAALIQVNAEYQFDASSHDTMSIGLNTKLDLRVGNFPVFALDWAFGPAVHFNWEGFRTTVAVGAGLFYVKGYDSSEWFADSEDAANDELYPELKTELKFDFFISSGLWLGFGLDLPLIFVRDSSDTLMAVPWFNIDVHVGYKF